MGKPVRRAERHELLAAGFMRPPEHMDNDEIKQKVDEDGLLEELADELVNGDADDALDRMENLGYDVDDLPL